MTILNVMIKLVIMIHLNTISQKINVVVYLILMKMAKVLEKLKKKNFFYLFAKNEIAINVI